MWQKLKAFIAVTEQAGFAKAAKQLGLSKATVTRYIKELEAEYRAKLFIRTTRHVSLTEQGESFYHYALEMIQLNDEAHDKITNTASSIEGNIKIGLPFSILYHFSQEKLARVASDHPNLSIEIIQGNHVNDLLSGYFDVVLHCGPLPDVNFYYKKIGTWKKMICAAPTYIKKFSKPKSVTELTSHNCLDHADNHTLCWPLMVSGKLQNIPVHSQIKVNSSVILKELAIQGLGIVYLPSFTVGDAVLTRKLEPILPNAWPESLSIYAIYPSKKHSNKKVELMLKVLSDFCQEI